MKAYEVSLPAISNRDEIIKLQVSEQKGDISSPVELELSGNGENSGK